MIRRLLIRNGSARLTCFLGTSEAFFYTQDGEQTIRVADPDALEAATLLGQPVDVFLVGCQGLITRVNQAGLPWLERLTTYWGLRRAKQRHQALLRWYGRVICYSNRRLSPFQEACLTHLRAHSSQGRVYEWVLSIANRLYTSDAHGVLLDAPDGAQYIHVWHGKAPVLTRVCRGPSTDQEIGATKFYLEKAGSAVPGHIMHHSLGVAAQWPRTVCLEKWGAMSLEVTRAAWGITVFSLALCILMSWQILTDAPLPPRPASDSSLQAIQTPLTFETAQMLLQSLAPLVVPVDIHYTPTALVVEAVYADGQQTAAQAHIHQMVQRAGGACQLHLRQENRLTLEVFMLTNGDG